MLFGARRHLAVDVRQGHDAAAVVAVIGDGRAGIIRDGQRRVRLHGSVGEALEIVGKAGQPVGIDAGKIGMGNGGTEDLRVLRGHALRGQQRLAQLHFLRKCDLHTQLSSAW